MTEGKASSYCTDRARREWGGLIDDAWETGHEEYRSWAERVLIIVLVTWDTVMEECLCVNAKDHTLKHGP